MPQSALVRARLAPSEEAASKISPGVVLWIDYDGEVWYLGADAVGTNTYLLHGPYEYSNMYEVIYRLIQDAEFFIEEPRPLIEVEPELAEAADA